MIIIPTPLAEKAADFVRSYALSQFPTWRPFAFRFEGRASLLSTDSFLDKPLDIYTKISSLTFTRESAPLGTIREESYEISSELSTSGLISQSNLFKITGNNLILARVLNPTRLVVYYLYQRDKTVMEDNRNLISADANTVVFASRHTLIDDLGFNKTDLDDGTSRIDFFGCDEKIIMDSLEAVSNLFRKVP